MDVGKGTVTDRLIPEVRKHTIKRMDRSIFFFFLKGRKDPTTFFNDQKRDVVVFLFSSPAGRDPPTLVKWKTESTCRSNELVESEVRQTVSGSLSPRPGGYHASQPLFKQIDD